MHPHGDSSPFDSPTFGRDASIRVDEPVGSASISPSSRDIVLASREGLHIIDLDNPYSPPRHLAHRTLWEVADVQWSPFASHDGLVASTSNQKALIWDLNHGNQPPLTLHAHSRAITDINLSAHHPDILATCAVDTFVHKWDLRTADKPVFSYAQWDGGAAQVKWNRQDPHILASAHDRFLCIWDERKGVQPLRTIEAHRSKIYGVDWNRTRQGGILTCSLDGSIKFWDYTREEDSMLERVIRTPFGVWRARHTPFGWGALAMPQRGDFDLHLYDRRLRDGVKRDAKVPAVHTFKGHNDQVKEFLWRTRGDVTDEGYDEREFQLVSWGSDRQLNLYRIDSSMLGSVGYKKGEQVRRRFHMTRQGALYKTFHDEMPTSIPQAKAPEQHQVHTFTAAPSQLSALFQSAGMSKPSLPYAQAAFQGPGASARDRGLTTMQARTREKKTVDKLTWMQGVRIGGRSGGRFDRHGSRPDVLSPDQALLWDSPESLGDEITHVGSKFKKVKFEEVEIPRRTATVTLNGPWGENESQVFMRISIRFPPDYPLSATPHCSLEKTTSYISEATISKLDSEIKALAEVYKNRKRGSLDAIISYLLGERGLEESISWLSDGAITDSGITQDEDSSSDEEDEVGADFATPAMEMSGTDILGPFNANANVPLPRHCGAVWSADGRLVTFFPPKPEPKPMFSNLATLTNDSRTYKSKRIFEVLGQLNKESPDPSRKLSSAVENPDDSDSQGSWETSSSSSSGSPVRGGGLSGIAPPVAWRGGPLKFQRSSQQSSAGYEVKAIAPKPKSVITIRNLANLLPAKRELAENYEIFGEGSEVCAHNAAVARDCGYTELADIWNLIGLILADQVPLEIMQQNYRREPILVVAKRTAVQIRKKDSGLDLSFDEPEAIAKPKLKSRVKWGNHPFARVLVQRLFNHFEKLADSQMLAMLSCMFHEPAASEGVTTGMMMRNPHADLHLSMRTPAFSLDYFPSKEVAASLFQPLVSITDQSNGIHFRPPMGTDMGMSKYDKRLNTFGSAGSSNGPWSGDMMPSGPTTPHSTGNTPPPTFSRSSTFRSASSAHASIASSPERNKRSSTPFTNALTSFSRPFTNVNSSPPVSHQRSRTFDGDLSTSAPEKSSVTWGPNTVYGGASTGSNASSSHRSNSHKRSRTGIQTTTEQQQQQQQQRFVSFDSIDEDGVDDPGFSDDEDFYPNFDDDKTDVAPVDRSAGGNVIHVTLKNQDQFDDDGHLSVALLDQEQQWMYAAYRASYANNELAGWGLQVKRSEVLKYNGLTSYWVKDEADENHGEDLAVGRSQESIGARSSTIAPDDLILCPLPLHLISTPTTSGPNTTSTTARSSATHTRTHTPDPHTLLNASAAAFAPNANHYHPLTHHPSTTLYATNPTPTPAPTRPPSTKSASPPNEKTPPEEDDDVSIGGANGVAQGAAARTRTCMVCWLQLDGLYRTCAECGHAVHAECGGGRGDGLIGGECWYCGG